QRGLELRPARRARTQISVVAVDDLERILEMAVSSDGAGGDRACGEAERAGKDQEPGEARRFSTHIADYHRLGGKGARRAMVGEASLMMNGRGVERLHVRVTAKSTDAFQA